MKTKNTFLASLLTGALIITTAPFAFSRNFDGTGPNGEGPGTGRGEGPCVEGRGLGRRLGRGRGLRRGLGRGLGREYLAPQRKLDGTGPEGKGPRTGRGVGPCTPENQTSKKDLEAYKQALQEEIETVKEEIEKQK